MHVSRSFTIDIPPAMMLGAILLIAGCSTIGHSGGDIPNRERPQQPGLTATAGEVNELTESTHRRDDRLSTDAGNVTVRQLSAEETSGTVAGDAALPVGASRERERPEASATQRAQYSADATARNGLTLQDVEQLAMANNPTLRQASYLVDTQRGRWLQAGLYPNPQFGYLGDEIGDDGTAGQQGAFIGQTFVTAGKLQWNRSVARRDIDRAAWRAEMQRRRVLTDIRIQFYEALGAQRKVQLAEELLKVARQGAAIARQLKAAKQAPQTDVLQAEIDQQTIELLLQNAKQQRAAALRQLAALAGLHSLPNDTLAGSLSSDEPLMPRDATLQRVLAENPWLQMARTSVERGRYQLQRERVQPIPDVNTRFATTHDFASDFTLFSVQVGVMLPLYNRNQGNISAAHAQLHQALENVARIRLLLRNRFAEVYRRYETAFSQAHTFRESILKKSKQTLDLTTEAAKGGQLDLLRVLTARRSYFQLQLRALSAEIELQKAKAELDGLLLTGGLMSPLNTGISGIGGSSRNVPGGIDTRVLTITPKTQ